MVYGLCPVAALIIGWLFGCGTGNLHPLLQAYSVIIAVVLGVLFGMLLALDIAGNFKQDQS